jgi:hypothetical protein
VALTRKRRRICVVIFMVDCYIKFCTISQYVTNSNPEFAHGQNTSGLMY